jgi:nucleoid-associated protein YgaU
VGGKFKINNGDKIFHSASKVYVEDVFLDDKGINVEGIINTEVCYHTTDEKDPIASARYAIPFSKNIELDTLNKDCITEIGIEDVATECELVSGEEIKADVEMVMKIMTCHNCSADMVTEVRETPVDMGKIKCMPGITGYIVQKGDTLWNIAKKYYTTVENIMEINKLKSDEIFPGMKLIIVKLYCL